LSIHKINKTPKHSYNTELKHTCSKTSRTQRGQFIIPVEVSIPVSQKLVHQEAECL
jgi:hypothetical protein